MLHYPDIDPVAFALGPIEVYWYGLMYLVGFGAGWWLGRHRAQLWGWSKTQVDDLVFYIILGVLCGGRLGYVLFYDFSAYVADPLAIFRVWFGGMSFHGGLLGVLVAVGWFAYRRSRKFFEVTDFLAPLCPIGLGLGRLGNFINGELWGKPTEVPWGMVFPFAETGGMARHPSQLYQAFLEGLVLFVILWQHRTETEYGTGVGPSPQAELGSTPRPRDDVKQDGFLSCAGRCLADQPSVPLGQPRSAIDNHR